MSRKRTARAAIPRAGTPREAAHLGTASLFEESTAPADENAAEVYDSPAPRIVHGPPDEERWTATVLAGIDEAGLGPLLGPLSIGYSAFRVPHGIRDLWAALSTACSADVDDDRERLVVADSKVVFTRNPRGCKRLERTVLAFLALRDRERQCPPTAKALLERMSCDIDAILTDALRSGASTRSDPCSEPWRSHLESSLPRHGRREDLEALLLKLVESMSRAEIGLTDCGVRLVPVSELNASFSETDNKSVTHWRATEDVLVHLWRAHGEAGLDLTVDRHGGRMRYAPLLAETFANCTVHVLHETPPRSEYMVHERVDAPSTGSVFHAQRSAPHLPSSDSRSLSSNFHSSGSNSHSPSSRSHSPGSESRSENSDPRSSRPDEVSPNSRFRAPSSDPRSLRRMRIVFAERAESSSFAVALASCLAKHARETCMDAFNAYFESLQPGLKPTAGYLSDGWRWLEEARLAIERSGIARRDLVRER